MKLDFNFQFKDISQNPIEGDDTNCAKILGQQLHNSNQSGSIKLYNWALQLWNKESIDVDALDIDILKVFVDKNEWITVGAKAQILISIDKQIKI